MTISALFFFLALAFFLLAGGVKDDNVDRAGGWAGMVAAGLAFWLASLEIINDVVGGKSFDALCYTCKQSLTATMPLFFRRQRNNQPRPLAMEA